ncbi:ATP-grasp domain-containing protein [Bdellovibrio sp. HCB337]|uniref:ATP-grasp domain-containing protein n=1 Tax=Bdellovibrio sp. HCB337 TaxID=3394358 RepID=UPI0039A4499A
MKIGILGGGQLGRMLWEASCKLRGDLDPSPVYHDMLSCPAGIAGATITPGKIIEVEKLTEFFNGVDSFAIENEFLHVESIETAWRDSRAGKTSDLPTPSQKGLRIAQDKLEQKKFFLSLGLPTSEYIEITPGFLETPEKLSELHHEWDGFVIKKARMGYDGKGNYAVHPDSVLNFAEARQFCQAAFESQSRVYVERFVPFTKEVALVSCRTVDGDYGHYPLIETVQKNGVCFLAFKALNQARNEKRAMGMARTIGEKLGMLGTYAVEFFITATGDLLVNEMAPRVHNSGHFTQAAAKSSQFEMHLKAYWQKAWDPADFECAPAFAMVNFLGPADAKGPVQRPNHPQIYWYDKETTSPGRKLGHMIVQGTSEHDLPELLDELIQVERAWQESLRAP